MTDDRKYIYVKGEKIYVSDEIYKAYKNWAIENNQYVMSSTKFGRELGSKFEKRKIMGVRIYKGIKVLREFESYQLSVGEF